MALREECERQGNLFFRWRSYIPLLLIIITIPAFEEYLHFNHLHDFPWELGALILSFIGELIRILTVSFVPKGTSGRVTKHQEAQKLNKTGIYSVVRHPLYLGNYIIWLGFFLLFKVWWLVVMVSLIYWVYYERIMFAEEEFLRKRFGEEFEKWADKTPAFIPSLNKYIPPELPFSLKTMLKREHTSIFGIISAFFAFEVFKNYILWHRLNPGIFWIILFIFGFLFYGIIFLLKKTTKILEVEGR